MDDRDVLRRIHELVDEEHRLRSRPSGRQPLTGDEIARLQTLEEQLDRCWDLLRQRRARRDAGQDPDTAHERPAREVESYLQ